MIGEDELRKMMVRAQGAINDQDRGVKIVMGMEPAVVFAMAAELLHFRGRVRELEEELIEMRQMRHWDRVIDDGITESNPRI